MFKTRDTVDIVVICLSVMLSASVVLIIAGAITLKIFRPEVDLKSAGQVIANVLQTIVGALVGFIGGRAAGRLEANGGKHIT